MGTHFSIDDLSYVRRAACVDNVELAFPPLTRCPRHKTHPEGSPCPDCAREEREAEKMRVLRDMMESQRIEDHTPAASPWLPIGVFLAILALGIAAVYFYFKYIHG